MLDLGGAVNTGVFVAEPSERTYKEMLESYEDAPSYNRGDQGFLNYYFNESVYYLPGKYNVMPKFMVRAMRVARQNWEDETEIV